MKTMKKISKVLSVTFIALSVLSYADEVLALHIPMYKFTYGFTTDERMLLRFSMISTPLFYLCIGIPFMREMEKGEE